MFKSCLVYFYSITDTCKRMYRDQNHDLCSIVQKVRRRNATKSCKLAAIYDFDGHFYLFLSDCLTLVQKLIFRTLPSNWYRKRNFCI